ncbi:hypothetical protein OIU79_004045 [Salix purpurea]|uniref:Uncharacterized protein n=1 Tax=Salix purpurea TaxID=77065 RepID=A0A9Q0U993_SALPP|nr:hypothetical protein OIU79_004045 [Salix purpurea]
METQAVLQERNDSHDGVEYNHGLFLAQGIYFFSLYPQQQTLN